MPTFERLTPDNFHPSPLDNFIRRQAVQTCWRRINGILTLVSNPYVEDLDLEQRRTIAQTLLIELARGAFAFGAFDGAQVTGYILISTQRFGSTAQYMELKLFLASAPFRHLGIRRTLFRLACAEVRLQGAGKLYISAHSSKESQAAYRRLGCVEATEVEPAIAEAEPFDIQMEYVL